MTDMELKFCEVGGEAWSQFGDFYSGPLESYMQRRWRSVRVSTMKMELKFNEKKSVWEWKKRNKKEKKEMNDTERLNWLEVQDGSALVPDDGGRWAVVTSKVQNVPEKEPGDISLMLFIEKDEWKPSVREAIDSAVQKTQEEATS